MPVILIRPYTQEYEAVLALWRAESATLGFMPAGGFVDAAREGRLLADQDAVGAIAGYLLCRTTSQGVVLSIVHLCVDRDRRCQGVATSLLNGLRERYPRCCEIRLSCRRDFAANALWPRLGFVSVGERAGRGLETRLTTWRFDVQSPPLLHLIEANRAPSSLVRAVIDANVFYDLDEQGPGNDASRGLDADWLTDLLELAVTEELYNEIDRGTDEAGRSRQRERARRFAQVARHLEREEELFPQIRARMPADARESSRSDARQLAMTVAGGVRFFVTRDEVILELADFLDDCFDVRVVAPHEVVCHFDELRRFEAYRPRRLFLGPGVASLRPRANDVDRMAALLHRGHQAPEPLLRTQARLREMMAQPDRFDATNVESKGELLASFVVERPQPQLLHVPFFAVAPTSLGPTAARHYGEQFVAVAAREGRSVVVVPTSEGRVSEALEELGFSREGDAWVKVTLLTTGSFDAAATHLETLVRIPAASALARRLATSFRALATNVAVPAQRVSQAERTIWPAKFKGTNLPSYVVPIRPGWAAGLFDRELAQQTLFGAEAARALSCEKVYFRSATPAILTAPARVLWYVSGDPAVPQSKAIRACSVVDEVVVGRPKALFGRFRRLGVYEWRDVLETAGGLDVEIMAFRFTHTELLPRPICWPEMQAILEARNGKRSPLASPIAISDECFFSLYASGLEGGATDHPA